MFRNFKYAAKIRKNYLLIRKLLFTQLSINTAPV